MVLGKNIKVFMRTTAFILISVLFSCEEIIIIDCTECVTNEPMEALLEIKLEESQQGAIITIYQGNLEDNIIFMQFSSFSEVAYMDVPLNKSYTLKAEYRMGEITYAAVNSVQPRVKFEEEKCTDPCYFLYDKKVDLRLKYN